MNQTARTFTGACPPARGGQNRYQGAQLVCLVVTAARLTFNHVIIYTRHLERSLRFYRDLLGFRVISQWGDGYARLRSPVGSTTIALHVDPKLKRGKEGLRLYFEVEGLDALCRTLAKRGVKFSQKPKDMEWGWRHAYLKDPDGHELSLYASHGKRLRPD